MSEDRIIQSLQRVDKALEAEISILRKGRFGELGPLQNETAEAMRALDALQAEIQTPLFNRTQIEAAISGVNRRAQQAGSLLAAALHGARDARNRLEGLIRAEGEVGAYNSQGGRLMMPSSASPYNKTI